MRALPILPGVALLWIGVAVFVFMVLLLSRPRTRPIGLLFLIVLGVGAGVLYFVAVPHYVMRGDVQTAVLQKETPLDAVPTIWSEGMEDRFMADIYPSRERAAQAMGRSITKSILKGGQVEKPLLIRRAADDDTSADLVEPVQRGIRNVVPDLAIHVSTLALEDPNASEKTELVLGHSGHRYDPVQDDDRVESNKGLRVLSAKLSWPGGSVSWDVPYLDVPWLTDTAAFMNRPAQQHRTVVYSTGSCNTMAEARRQAMRQATSAVATQISLSPRSPRRFSVTPEDIENSGLIVDRFIQSLNGTAGRIWRQALLLDVSPEKIAPLKQAKQATRVTVRKTWFSLLVSAAGLGLVILILYIFLNAATRGYYTWSLRVAAVVVTGVVLAAIFLLKQPM